MTTPNGRDQVEQYGELAKTWQPDNLAGFQIGDGVRLPSIAATFRVVGFQPPAVLILKAPSGKEVRAGWQAVARVRTRAEIGEPAE